MIEIGIKTKLCVKKRDRIAISEQHISTNILNQEFDTIGENKLWLSDMSTVKYGINREKSIKTSAVIDVHSRYVLVWILTETETTEASVKKFKEAFEQIGEVHHRVHTVIETAYTAEKFNNFIIINSRCE